jgi:TolB-like protein/Tfp pilus assembly protein PilF
MLFACSKIWRHAMHPRTRANDSLSASSDARSAEIRACVKRISGSNPFASSPRRGELLRYLVEHTLAGTEPSEYAIGRDIFGRPESFDPRLDSIVRTEISRIRQKLKEYYATEGAADPISIEILPRNYAPSITSREPVSQLATIGNKRRAILLIALAGLAGIALAALLAVRWIPRASSANTVAVLPFQNLSPNGVSAYVADGVTEELTNQLAQRRDLRVVARTSASVFKNKAADIREIGRQLNVAAVLEGSVSIEGDRVRITAQLNRTRDGYHMWSRSLEAPYTEIMQLQAQVADAVYSVVQPKAISAARQRSATTNAQAHDLYLQANYQFAQGTPASMANALQLFQSAVKIDSQYEDAYRGIARSEIGLIHITAEAPGAGFKRARKALETAIGLDPNDAEAFGQLADIDYVYDWNWPLAEREFRLALDHGAQSTTHSFYGWGLATRGRFKEAHEQLRLAQDLDPLGAGPVTNEAMTYLFERRFDDARRLLEQVLMSRSPLDAHILLGVAALNKHDCGETASQFESVADKVPAPLETVGRAFAAACRGDRDRARQYLQTISTGSQSGFVSPYQIAMGYAAIHDSAAAIAFLEKSKEAREGQILYIRYDAIFDGIRTDPRFTELQRTFP